MTGSIKLWPRNIAWYAHAFFTLLLFIPQMLSLKKIQNKMPEKEFTELAYEAAHKWMLRQLKWSGVKVNVTGQENIPECPVVFIANHQSYFDIGVFLTKIGKVKGFVSKIEMKKAPVVSSFMDFIGCVYMDRSDIKKSARAINEGIEKIKNGRSIVIFPEGTRSRSNEMGEWKAGSLKLATKSGAPVVPVTFYNSFLALEANRYKFKPVTVSVVISEPVLTENLSNEQIAELPSKLKGVIQSNIDMLKKSAK